MKTQLLYPLFSVVSCVFSVSCAALAAGCGRAVTGRGRAARPDVRRERERGASRERGADGWGSEEPGSAEGEECLSRDVRGEGEGVAAMLRRRRMLNLYGL